MSVPCPACGSDNEPASRFCVSCGATVQLSCRRCASPIPADARFCPACGQPLRDEPTSEERKIVTALFVDLADSTSVAERLDPERFRSILSGYFAMAAATVEAWGGAVEKYVGDAVLAVFGVPRVREDDAARAVSAAAEIASRFADVAADAERRHGVRLAARIGVNTGEVIAPSETRPDRPMVTGDAINVAARLQASAAPGSVLVGDRTYRSTASLFRYGERIELELKGKTERVAAYPLLGVIEGAVEAGPVRNLEARVVGREREMAVIAGLLDEAIETRSPRLAVVYGPAGIGKSRLVKEAIGLALAERPDIRVLRGRCPAVGHGIVYWPLAEVVRGACSISLDDDAASAAAKLTMFVRDVLSPLLPEPEVEAVAFALAATAGIALPDNPFDRMRPIAAVYELARRWPQFVSGLAARRPLILVVEDLHWASDQVVDLLERLLVRSAGQILIVGTARPEFAEAHPSYGAASSDRTTTHLRPLSRGQSANLLKGLLPGHDLPRDIEDQVLETAEGNPLFLEEIVGRLVDVGTLTKRDGMWRTAIGATVTSIPDSISAVLGARIDGLPDAERRVLREASVVGRIFWEEPVAVAVGSSEASVEIAELERRGLVAMRPTSTLAGKAEYIFKHALVRDVAYAGLSMARRATAHAAVGAWLAALSPERPEELAELVAFHYEAALGEGADLAWPSAVALADVRRRARAAFLIGGSTARKRHAVDRSIELHQRAVELSSDETERLVALEELGDDFDAAYDGDQALRAWNEALDIARSHAAGRSAVARMTMKAARAAAIRWGGFSVPVDPAVSDGFVDEGLAAGADGETRAWLLAIRAAVGLRWVAFHRPDPMSLEVRARAGEDALALARATGDASLESTALRAVGALLLAYGRVDRALELTRDLLVLTDRIHDPRERHLAIIEAAQTLIWTGGDAVALIEPLEAARKLAQDLRVHDMCHSTGTLMNALYLAGRWDELVEVLDDHLRTFQADDAGTSCPFALGGFQLGALVLASRGATERARQIAASMPTPEAPIGIVQGLQAMAAVALGDAAGGRRIAEEVLATGARNFAEEPPVELVAELDALVALGEWEHLRAFLPVARQRASELALARPAIDRAIGVLAAAEGRVEDAREALERSVRGFEVVSPFETARSLEALAAVDVARRDAHLAEALARYERLGARSSESRIRGLLRPGRAAPAAS